MSDQTSMLRPPELVMNVFGDPAELGYLYTILNVDTSSFSVTLDTFSSNLVLPCSGCTANSCGKERLHHLLHRKKESVDLKCADPHCRVGCMHLTRGEPDWCPFQHGPHKGIVTRGSAKVFENTFSENIYCSFQIEDPFKSTKADGTLGLGTESTFITSSAATGWTLSIAPPGYTGGEFTLWTKNFAQLAHGATWTDNYVATVNAVSVTGSKTGNVLKTSADLHIHTASKFSMITSRAFESLKNDLVSVCMGLGNSPSSGCGGFHQVSVDGEPAGTICVDLSKAPNYANAQSIGEIFKSFPALSIDISGLEPLQLGPLQYMMLHHGSVYCLGIYPDGPSPTPLKNERITLGMNLLRGLKIEIQFKPQQLLKLSYHQLEFPKSNFTNVRVHAALETDDTIAFLMSFVIMFTFTACVLYMFKICLRRFKGDSKYAAGQSMSPEEVELALQNRFTIGSLDDMSVSSGDRNSFYDDDDRFSVDNDP